MDEDEEHDADVKKLLAEQRASEVFRALETISREARHIKRLMKNHDPAIGKNAERRDCDTFKKRLQDLLLWERAKEFAQ